jgi:hypothetical protein
MRHRDNRTPCIVEECSICCEEFEGAPARLGAATGRPAAPAILILPPCNYMAHATCSACLARIATQWHNHPIGPGSSHITCPHEGCNSTYETEEFAGILDADDMNALRSRAARFGDRGQFVACPVCAAVVDVPFERMHNQQQGAITFESEACDITFCYCCHSALGPSRMPLACGVCLEDVPTSSSLNRYFVREGKTLTDSLYPHMRNYELGADLCARQIAAMCADELVEACAGCGTKMHRSSECAELSHCGIHRCWHCGMSGFEHEDQLIDHYTSSKCPLYETSPFWERLGLRSLCTLACQNDRHDCRLAAHAGVRAKQTTVRRVFHVRSALFSLDHALRSRVMGALARDARPEVHMITAYAMCRDIDLSAAIGGGGERGGAQ